MANKALVITGFIGLAAAGTIAALKLSGKANAATDLKIAFGALNIKSASLKDGVKFDVVLKATNSSAYDLKFTQPFVTVSIANNSNGFDAIAQSTDAQGVVSLPARTTSNLLFNLNITPMQALKIPVFVLHIVKKIAKIIPAPQPKKILVQYGLTSSGININQKQDVVI